MVPMAGWSFDFNWTPNTTDAQGRRYCFGNQPDIAYWNLARLAAALAPLIQDNDALEQGLKVFGETFNHSWLDMLASKLGLSSLDHPEDGALVSDLFDLLQKVETDMTLFFRGLMELPVNNVAEGVSIARDVLKTTLWPRRCGRRFMTRIRHSRPKRPAAWQSGCAVMAIVCAWKKNPRYCDTRG